MSMTAPTTSDDGLKTSIYISAGLHLVVLLFLYFGLPHLMPPLPERHEPVPFQIVDISELTNTRVKDDTPPPPKPPEPEPAKPPEAKQEAIPAPTMPPPEPPKPQVEALKPIPIPTPKPKPPETKTTTEDFSKLLKNLEKKKPAEVTKPAEAKPEAKAQPQPVTAQASALSDRLSISAEDALRRQIESCWNMPIGARDAHNLIVEVVIDVNPDRTVLNVDIVDKARYATDSFFRSAAESAIRALHSPKCTPLELPPDEYNKWKRIDFNFDPRDAL